MKYGFSYWWLTLGSLVFKNRDEIDFTRGFMKKTP